MRAGDLDNMKFDLNYLRFVKSERLVPFGIGKRNCMGEVLARQDTFFLFRKLISHSE